jgi:hypothetical protein
MIEEGGAGDDQPLFAWPPLSPDSTQCDFCLWGYINDQVYFRPLHSSIPKTITADMLQTVWNELDYRVDVCRITKVAHIVHL